MKDTNKYVTLHFNLEDPYAKLDMHAALRGSDLVSAIREIDNEVFRKRIKYESDKYTDKEYELLETLRKEMWAVIEDAVPNFSELEY